MKLSYMERYKRSLKVTIPAFIVSLILDLAVIFIAYRWVPSDKFMAMFGIYTILISLPIGLIYTLISCNATKNSWNGRNMTFKLLFFRCVLIFVASFIAIAVNKSWSATPQGMNYGYTVGSVLAVGGIFFVAQFFACYWFIENFRTPKNEKLFERAAKIPHSPREFKPDPKLTPSSPGSPFSVEEMEKFKNTIDNY